jgi:hypothetical protein
VLAVTAVTVSASVAVLAAGCGSKARQDAREASGKFDVEVLKASFSGHQAIAKPATFELRVRNAGSSTIPNIAVTLDSFSYKSSYPALAENLRPVWVVEQGPGGTAAGQPVESESVSPPGGAQTAYVSTWALGTLAPESSQTFEWRVVPVKSGKYTVHYTVAGGLAGKARAQKPSGGAVSGALTADVASAPAPRHVNPSSGAVVPGLYPKTP